MDINKVLNNQRLCFAILGIGKKEFEDLLSVFTKIWHEHLNSKKRERIIGGGSKGNIKDPRKKLFFILWYCKNYPTCDLAAYVFNSSKSRTHHWVKTLLPILEKTLKRKVVLPKRQISTVEQFYLAFPGVKEVMIDGLERPTVRRKKNKNQNKDYSGKKKDHTRKNLIITDHKKRIRFLSPTKHGKVHDKKMFDKFRVAIPEEISVLADTGFQGLQHIHKNTLIPKKKSKLNPLTDIDKQFNRLISSVRVGVEHAISGIKRFGIVKHIFRGRLGQDDRYLNVACGLYNLRLG